MVALQPAHLLILLGTGLLLWAALRLVLRGPDGARWLQRWGLGRPATTDEAQVVRRRVRAQRGWTVVGLVVAGSVLGALPGSTDGAPPQVRWVAALLLGLLLGELVTVARQQGRRVRTASLTPRPPTALVAGWSRWGLRGGTVVVLVLLGVVALQARWWSSPAPGSLPRTSVLGGDLGAWPVGATTVAVGAVLTLLVAELVVHLAVTRPAGGGTEDVDLLLRARSARVATGAALGLTGFLAATALFWSHARVESLRGVTDLDGPVSVWADASGAGIFVVAAVGALAWIYAANPPGRSVLRAVSA